MLKNTSKNFKKYFLLEFTKELIRNTDAYKSLLIKKEIKIIVHEHEQQKEMPRTPAAQKKEVRKVVKEKIIRDSEAVSRLKKEEEQPFAEFFRERTHPTMLTKPVRRGIPPPLFIPEPSLPATVQYIKPFPTEREMDLGKLNLLVRDPLVKIIECNGPDEKIVVMGMMGRKNTGIILNKEEIDEVIQHFSEASKIPVHEGFFRVVIGRLILSAIVSDIIGSKFIIRKMSGPRLY